MNWFLSASLSILLTGIWFDGRAAMPLHILALLVIVGLAAIISAIHFSGGSRAVAPMTAELAMQRFCEDHQMTRMTECVLAEDGSQADTAW